MFFAVARVLVSCAVLGAVAFSTPARAQSGGEQKSEQPRGQEKADGQKDPAKRADEFAEAARVLGGPAANPECVWLGRRVVHLLWRDDLDTAFRHLDMYDRFGCPSGHVQQTFRCVVRQGALDPKVAESLSNRVHACWVNPNLTSQTAAPAGASNPQQSSTGTNTQQ